MQHFLRRCGKPRAEQVELTCVAENALVHTADQS